MTYFALPPLCWGEVVVALHDDKHVIDANSQEKEGDDVVHGAVEEPDSGADAVGEADGHPDRGETGQREHRPLLDAVETAKHQGDVDKDDKEADGHHDRITGNILAHILISSHLEIVSPAMSEYPRATFTKEEKPDGRFCLWIIISLFRILVYQSTALFSTFRPSACLSHT